MYKEPRALGVVQRTLVWAHQLGAALHRAVRDAQTDDMAAVSALARGLEISDFELFRRAYRSWYGVDSNPHAIERQFGHYLNGYLALPFYVRRYAARLAVLAA